MQMGLPFNPIIVNKTDNRHNESNVSVAVIHAWSLKIWQEILLFSSMQHMTWQHKYYYDYIPPDFKWSSSEGDFANVPWWTLSVFSSAVTSQWPFVSGKVGASPHWLFTDDWCESVDNSVPLCLSLLLSPLPCCSDACLATTELFRFFFFLLPRACNH